jgi:drug/metabolite transporter, DME family
VTHPRSGSTGVLSRAGLSRLAGYLFALGAGAVWGTTGPLSTALYAEGASLTGIGFWRVLLGLVALALWGLFFYRGLFRVDRRGLLVVGLAGGALVALFEVGYQFGIFNAGIAGAAALLYLAPVMVALVAKPILGEPVTLLRIALALVVMAGAAMTVMGGSAAESSGTTSLVIGVAGGLMAALSYTGTTVLARWAVPRYGVSRVLYLELLGGTAILTIVLPLAGRPPTAPTTLTAWMYVVALAAGAVLLANYFFFSAVKRIEAAPTAIAATIEPVVGALLGLLLFSQHLTVVGWLGLALVVGGVAMGYWKEGAD